MKTTTTKLNAAKTKIAEVTRSGDDQHNDSAFQRAYAKLDEALHGVMLEIKAPSFMRIIAASLVTLCVAAGIGWMAGVALNAVTLAAFAVTGSVAVAVLIWIIGFVLTIAAVAHVAAAAGMLIYTGKAEQVVANAYHGAKGWISSFVPKAA